jgi:DNA-binding NtrC family response regulator
MGGRKMLSTQQKTILIIESDKALKALYELELQEEGFNTLLASNSSEAQQLLDSNSVDLLMSDMPKNRVAGLSSLALLAKAHNIPLLINTGYPLSMIDRSAIKATVYFQEKSSDIDKLKSTISRFWERSIAVPSYHMKAEGKSPQQKSLMTS